MAISVEALLQAHASSVDAEKKGVIAAGRDEALFVVAGPGTGKTACLALRVLKLVYVDRMDPAGIIATTFTRKAASELRSRILGWGFRIRDALLKRADLGADDREWVRRADINQMTCGTLDSLCDRLLTEFRPAGRPVFSTVDEVVNFTLLKRDQFLFTPERRDDDDLDRLLRDMVKSTGFGWGLDAKVAAVIEVGERIRADRVDTQAWLRAAPAEDRAPLEALLSILSDHEATLRERGYLSYSGMATEVLARLQSGDLAGFADKVQAVLVDEYQDTNLLQELLYFALAKASKGRLTVVGDDDQSLYRFRGATVELFSEFPARYRKAFGREPSTHFLKTNYRSTQPIVDLVNTYATLDGGYQAARVRGKPRLELPGGARAAQAPVLGLFRDHAEEVARDVAALVHDLVHGDGYALGRDRIRLARGSGSAGDIAILCATPAEQKDNGDRTFVGHLRSHLESPRLPIRLFNPRGRGIHEDGHVRCLMGLLLQCLDPDGATQAGCFTTDSLRAMAGAARHAAEELLEQPSAAAARAYVKGWQGRGAGWPRSVPVLELLYALVRFLPGDPMSDPEFVAHLEAVTRQAGAAAEVGNFAGEIVHEREGGVPTELERASTKETVRDFILEVLDGSAALDEDILPSFPRDRLSVLSIHQAKGLEFPVVIVDVGTAFRVPHHTQAFKRFPSEHGRAHELEDRLRAHSSLGVPDRTGLDRAFDDLFRQYFVAFSRPESLLVLAGTRGARPGGNIPNVATGRDRNGRSSEAFQRLIKEV